MLRQQAARLAARCRLAKSWPACELPLAPLAQEAVAVHHARHLAMEAAAAPRSLAAWLVDGWRPQAAPFSTSLPGRAAEGQGVQQAGSQRQGGAESAAPDEQAGASTAGDAAAAEEDPYAGLTQEQMAEALRGKDEAIAQGAAQAEELTDLLKRTLADMENLRKRTARQAESAQKFAIQGFLKSMLDVGDNLERAYAAVPPEALQSGGGLGAEQATALLQGLVDGLKMTEKVFDQALRQHGVEKFRPEGAKFDPNMHEALFELPDPAREPGTVGAVTKTGYLLHGRVVRPAQVGVVRAP